jgi:transcriptional regulator with XRE-family HTH domain
MLRVSLAHGQRVRHWRELRGLQQGDLAAKANMDHARLCRIELGKTEARAEEIERLAEAMGLTMAEFYAIAVDEIVATAKKRPKAS